jgi:hypothetical protein
MKKLAKRLDAEWVAADQRCADHEGNLKRHTKVSTMTALLVNTPRYVLLDGKQRLSPKLLGLQCGPECVAIYGFSDKQPYDLFCANSDVPLTPYPLVKGYLKNQITESGNTVHLVVVDAAGPQEAHLNAATMNSVLEAQEQEANHVTISFRLTLDQDSQSYRVEKASSGLDGASRPAETQRT